MERRIFVFILSFALANGSSAHYTKSEINSNPRDSFIVVDDSRLFYRLVGTGPQSVIFITGLGEPHTSFQQIQDSISTISSTLSYDRAGLGKSDYNGQKKDLVSMVNELFILVRKTKVPRPFILVGHSLGCQIAKEYAFRHPDDISGIIFLDPGYDESKLKEKISDSIWKEREKMISKYTPVLNAAQKSEKDNLNESCRKADLIKRLPTVPISLYTATSISRFPASEEEFKVKKSTHEGWLKSLLAAKHILVNSSRHYIHVDEPQMVIDAIKTMIRNLKI